MLSLSLSSPAKLQVLINAHVSAHVIVSRTLPPLNFNRASIFLPAFPSLPPFLPFLSAFSFQKTMPREEEDRKCCACTVEWAMWGNMNAFYAGLCKNDHLLCIYGFIYLVIFVGSVVAASIPEIAIDGQFPTNVGSALRWINLYPLLIMKRLYLPTNIKV